MKQTGEKSPGKRTSNPFSSICRRKVVSAATVVGDMVLINSEENL